MRRRCERSGEGIHFVGDGKHPRARGPLPAKKRAARRRALRLGVGAVKRHALAREAVEVRRGDVLVAVGPDAVPPEIVGEDEDDVGRRGGNTHGGGKNQRRGQEQQGSETEHEVFFRQEMDGATQKPEAAERGPSPTRF